MYDLLYEQLRPQIYLIGIYYILATFYIYM
jgi:hypothetical protein